jgi:uncharacterized membrane-anchored protein YhcB (DUF1043 family)
VHAEAPFAIPVSVYRAMTVVWLVVGAWLVVSVPLGVVVGRTLRERSPVSAQRDVESSLQSNRDGASGSTVGPDAA